MLVLVLSICVALVVATLLTHRYAFKTLVLEGNCDTVRNWALSYGIMVALLGVLAIIVQIVPDMGKEPLSVVLPVLLAYVSVMFSVMALDLIKRERTTLAAAGITW